MPPSDYAQFTFALSVLGMRSIVLASVPSTVFVSDTLLVTIQGKITPFCCSFYFLFVFKNQMVSEHFLVLEITEEGSVIT